MKTGLTLTELDERIAAIRENLEELVEQSAAAIRARATTI